MRSIRRRSNPGPASRTTSPKRRRVNLDSITHDEVRSWQPGEVLLLSGKLLTGRDAAHKRMTDMLNRGEKLPVDLKGRFIYYVGPVDAVRDEAVGPAGPTTATRMDKFTRQMLAETGLYGMVGKAERGPAAIDAIRDYQAVYLMAVGGAAYLVSKAIKSSKVLAFADLGMEAIYEFDVKDMPVTVAVDSKGTSVHKTGPAEWSRRIAGIPWNSHPVMRRASFKVVRERENSRICVTGNGSSLSAFFSSRLTCHICASVSTCEYDGMPERRIPFATFQ